MNKLPKYIYLFYIKGPIISSELNDWLEYENESLDDIIYTGSEFQSSMKQEIYFYGFTDSKKMAKEFMEIRNEQKIFYFKRDANLYFQDTNEYEKFKTQFRTHEIKQSSIMTRSKNPKTNQYIAKEISLYLTRFEEDYICTTFEALDDELYTLFEKIQSIDIIFGCLTGKMKDTMYSAGFLVFIKYLHGLYTNGDTMQQVVALDELVILIKYFYELFKGGDNIHENSYVSEETE